MVHRSRVTDAVTIGNNVNEEFRDDAQGFSAQPRHMMEASHRVANDFSRKYYIVTRNPDSQESQQILNDTAAKLRSGETDYVIVEKGQERLWLIN